MNVEKMEFTYKSYAELFDISLTTSKRDLTDLFQKKLISRKKIKNAFQYLHLVVHNYGLLFYLRLN